MGHYLYCRHYRVRATLPFFIPAPTLIGTLGAFIRIGGRIESRAALFDIGIAGPIAGFVVALIVLVIAMTHSRVMPGVMANSDIEMGYPLIFHLLWRGFFRSPTWSRSSSALPGYLFPSHCGCSLGGNVATALNLLPAATRWRAYRFCAESAGASRRVQAARLGADPDRPFLGRAGWYGRSLLRISGMRHPMVEEWPGGTPGRRWLAGFALLMMVVTLTPAPFAHSSLLQVVRAIRGQ